jgi:hypothetical protein
LSRGGRITFLRVIRATVSEGVKREYVRVVEAYRDHDGKARHRTVINLGRRDLLATHLDLGKLSRLLHGEAADDGRIERDDVGAVGAWDWGSMLAARAMWSELGLDAMLACAAPREGRPESIETSSLHLDVLQPNRLRDSESAVSPRGTAPGASATPPLPARSF